ncbi:MAG: dihydroorotase family protein, partial [Flavobacteriaceae bacterium]
FMDILIRSAKIVDASNKEHHLKKRDILIKNGIIESIAPRLETKGKAKEISHKNLCVSVGWFDSGVNFGEPGFEERETIENGLATAAHSGFTDVVLNTDIHPVPNTGSDIAFLKKSAEGHLANLWPLGALTSQSKGIGLAELYDMKNAGAIGFYDYKMPIGNANLLKIALLYAQNFDGLVFSFPLDRSISGKGIVNEGAVSTSLGLKGIPALAEELQIARDLFILEYTGGRLHIPTISTAQSVKLIAQAKRKGLRVSCSTAIHNLFFTDDTLKEFDSKYKVMPPLRTQKDAKALVKGLENGIIDCVTTDHAPMNTENKMLEFSNAEYGTIGLESAFGALNELFDLETVVGLLTNGRNCFGMEPPKIQEGEKAHLTLFDPMKEYTFSREHVRSTSKNSMFLDHTLKGKVLGTINNGKSTF